MSIRFPGKEGWKLGYQGEGLTFFYSRTERIQNEASVSFYVRIMFLLLCLMGGGGITPPSPTLLNTDINGQRVWVKGRKEGRKEERKEGSK